MTCNNHKREYLATQNRARKIVRQAVLSGTLERPDRCTKCRKVKPLDAHHWRGYRFPLTVRWLCRSCHRYAEGPERGRFFVHLWQRGVYSHIKVDGNVFSWWKGAGWTSLWIDVPARQFWDIRKRFAKYYAFEWVNRELLDYRYRAHLAAVRAELFRASGQTTKLRAERRRLNGLRQRVRYWEVQAQRRRQQLIDGTTRFL